MKEKRIVSYLIGFILSIILTGIAYFMAVNHILDYSTLVVVLLSFAVVQLVVQLWFFLHLGRERKPHWNLIFLIATVAGVVMVITASIWIIHNLNYHMTPQQVNTYLHDQQGAM